MDYEQIFILGAPRSGTTAISRALTQIEGFSDANSEGHFLYLFQGFFKRITEGSFNQSSIVLKEKNKALLFKSFSRMIDRLWMDFCEKGTKVWIDKTPDCAQVIFLEKMFFLFPKAKFCFMYRDPDLILKSTYNCWKTRAYDNILERWQKCFEAWSGLKKNLTQDQIIEIYQPDLFFYPERVLKDLSRWLSLSENETQKIVEFLGKNMINSPLKKREKSGPDIKLSEIEVAAVKQSYAKYSSCWPKLQINTVTT